ncbi:MAG: hypothetical protein II797_00185 [Clostridia bacterium]|nr:hypothetical protein [Clostridia bacterium]
MANQTIDRQMEYENPLCFELQKRFQNRGINAPGLASRIQSSEVVRRISEGLDPYEEIRKEQAPSVASEEAMQGVYENVLRPARREESGIGLQYIARKDLLYRSDYFDRKHTQGFVRPSTKGAPDYRELYRRASSVRVAADRFEKEKAENRELRRSSGIYSVPLIGLGAEFLADLFVIAKRFFSRIYKILFGIPFAKTERASSKRRAIPVGGVTLAAVFIILVLVIVYSFAQVSQVKNEIGSLEKEKAALVKEQSELSLALEKRDDIRVIQDIAMNQLGMVSADTLESRYISVASGDNITLEANENGETSGTLLSALQRLLQK